MLEVFKRYPKKGVTLFVGHDPEGRKGYLVTRNLFGGMVYEPSSPELHSSQKAAWEAFDAEEALSRRLANCRF